LPYFLLRAISARWLQWFGCCSFSIYLWQQPFFVAVNEGRLNPVLALLVSLGVGALSYYLFENPLRHYLNKKWAHRSDISHSEHRKTQSKLVDAGSS
jgi:peptidoglycan/LPS O-acetylase OafA/YrhL